MRIAANSLMASLLATAIIAIALAPLANLSDVTCTLLFYFKFTLVVAATFLARFCQGRPAAWWFGFAAFGWGSILISNPANVPSEFYLNPRLNLADLASSVAGMLQDALMPGRPGGYSPKQMREFAHLRAVAQVWFLILTSLTGGWIALVLEDRRNRQATDVESNDLPDSLTPHQ